MFVATPESTAAAEKIYQSSADAHGYTMNLTRAWAWRPDVFEGFAALRTQLTKGSSLSKREIAVIVCATASQLGDAYCSLAWGKNLAAESSGAAAAAVLAARSAGELSARDLALATWARKVVKDPNRTTQADVDALRAAG